MFSLAANFFTFDPIDAPSGSRTAFSLNAAYVHNTSGPAVAIRWQALTTDPITELYLFLEAVTGTLGNITMSAAIYNEHASAAGQIGGTQRDTVDTVTMPNAAGKWIKFDFSASPYTPAVGETLWLVVWNTAVAPATDFPGITNSISFSVERSMVTLGAFQYTSTNGFSTTGTAAIKMPFAVKQGSRYFGQPHLSASSFASSTLRKGIVVTPKFTFQAFGLAFSAASANYSGIEIYDPATAPGGTPLASYPLGTMINGSRDEVIGKKIFATPFTFIKETKYYVVLTYGTTVGSPTRFLIEDYASYPTVFDGMVDGHFICGQVIDNSAGGWAVDKSFAPYMSLMIGDVPSSGAFIPVGAGDEI